MQMLELKPQNPGPQDRLQLGFIALKFIEEHYLAGADKTSAKVSPLFEDDLQGLPPAYVLTAGLDPLRKEGRAYADKLRAAGTRVDYYHEKAMPHGFLNFARAFPSAKRVSIDVAEFLRANI
jgi:acetyl esterase